MSGLGDFSKVPSIKGPRAFIALRIIGIYYKQSEYMRHSPGVEKINPIKNTRIHNCL